MDIAQARELKCKLDVVVLDRIPLDFNSSGMFKAARDRPIPHIPKGRWHI
jgi:hypothetical protein